jgi:hypothetical protein
MRLATVLLMLSTLVVSAQDKQFVPLPTAPAPNFNPREAEGAFDILLYVDGEAFLYVKDTGLNYLPLSGAPIRNAGTNYSQGIPAQSSVLSMSSRKPVLVMWTSMRSRVPRTITPR